MKHKGLVEDLLEDLQQKITTEQGVVRRNTPFDNTSHFEKFLNDIQILIENISEKISLESDEGYYGK